MIERYEGNVVTPDGVIAGGVVAVAAGEIVAVGQGAGGATRPGLPWILPGFVDIHVHGGGGSAFDSPEPGAAAAAASFHARAGTTTMLASLVTAGAVELADAVGRLTPLVASGALAGVHLEGPYLSPLRRGAHNPAYLRAPDLAELADLLAPGVVSMVTLAPELPGALPAIEALVRRGVIAAVGHTDATYEQCRDAILAGARVATHLANGMRPINHRDPGPVIALLEAGDVVLEQIVDGHHLHDAFLRHVVAQVGPGRVALVSDAIAAAGLGDGRYELGGLAIGVRDGQARLVEDGSLAGSTTTVAGALRRAVAAGLDLVTATSMAASTPARVLGLDRQIGSIRAGLRADLVFLDEELAVTSVLRAGLRPSG